MLMLAPAVICLCCSHPYFLNQFRCNNNKKAHASSFHFLNLRTALAKALYFGHLRAALLLLQRGASLDVLDNKVFGLFVFVIKDLHWMGQSRCNWHSKPFSQRRCIHQKPKKKCCAVVLLTKLP